MQIHSDILYDISELIEKNQLVLFLGAGTTQFCQKSDGKHGFTSQELADEIIKDLNDGKEFDSKVPLSKAADFFVASPNNTRKKLDNFITDRLSGLLPDIGHLLITLFPWKAIITTNYNIVIEDAYKIAQQEGFAKKNLVIVRTDEELMNLNPSPSDIVLYKPHGSISLENNESSRIIITSRDYFDSMKIRPIMYAKMNSIVRRSSTVFIGYSMNDYTFRNIYYDLHDQLGYWQMRSYNVSRKPHPLIYEWTKQSLDKNYNTSLIRSTFDSFMIQLMLYQKIKIHSSLKKRIVDTWPKIQQQNDKYLGDITLEMLINGKSE